MTTSPKSALASADPVYALIEEHRRAHAARAAILDSDDWSGLEAIAAADAEYDAADRLLTGPSTVAGAAALLRYAYESGATGTMTTMAQQAS